MKVIDKGLPPEFPLFRISPLDAVQKFGRRDDADAERLFFPPGDESVERFMTAFDVDDRRCKRAGRW